MCNTGIKLFAVGLLPCFFAAAALQAAPPPMPPQNLLVEAVTLKPDNIAKKYVGHLEAIDEVTIPARVSGLLTEIHFNEGEMVTKGQLLFVIEDTTYRAKANMARAAVDQCKVDLDYAQSNYHRQKVLFDKKAVSEAVYDEAVRLLETSKAKLASAEATRLDAENELSYTKIYAPIAGRISKATYTCGNYVTPLSNPLANIVSVDPIYLRFAVSERDYLDLFGSLERMRENADVKLQLSNHQLYRHEGKVTLIDNRIDSKTGTLTVWATIANPELMLTPGAYTTVLLSRKDAEIKPVTKLSALMTDQMSNYVYVVGDKNVVERRNVRPGAARGADQFIESGLRGGELVIVDGTHKTAPGATINPVRSDLPAKNAGEPAAKTDDKAGK
ncbi:MAG: efflux RND transporter periplasmic adaptor subunit [Victivallaceae bacterium]